MHQLNDDQEFAKVFLDTCYRNFFDINFAVTNLENEIIMVSPAFSDFSGLTINNNLLNLKNSKIKEKIITEIKNLRNNNSATKSRLILRNDKNTFNEINLSVIINPYTNNQLFVTISINPYIQNDLLLEIRRINGFKFSQKIPNQQNLDKLSDYQQAICYLLVQGITNQGIAEIITHMGINIKSSNNARFNSVETSRTAINKQVDDIRDILGSPSKQALITYLLDNEYQKRFPKLIFGDEIVLS
ncbi:MAG: hypothetical protein EKK54_06020 [Neisseriaceae bacterium]|nr:MAG: hypothetical protein EKK54_06020 [Neisseriaceae bacterium]